MIRCQCDVCQSNDPRDQRLRSSIYVQTSDRSWVVDTGAEFRIQILRENVQNLDAVLYSHSHADHIMGFDDLRRFGSTHGGAIPIYGSRETIQNLEKCFAYAFNGTARFPGYVLPEPHFIEGPFRLGDTTIHPIRVEHGRAHVFGFLFRQGPRSVAAYLSDCKTIYPDELKILEGVETLILGTPCRRTHPTHMNMIEGMALAKRLSPRQTYFTHLSHDFRHAATQQELPDNVFLAYDGLRLEL